MLTLPNAVAEVFTPFQRLFVQQRSWRKVQLLLVGVLLCRGKRTVSRVLRVMGLEHDQHYCNYYRVLSRVGWSGLAGAEMLLGLIVSIFVQPTVVIGVDETLERRWGKQIWGLGIYRDGVKSSHKHTVKSSGVRWQVMQVLVTLPWSRRVWGLPFLSVMVPAASAVRQGNRAYKSSLDWAIQMVIVVGRWLKRRWVCVADGGYGNAKFGWACRLHNVALVARMPWKANLYDFAPTMPKRYRGRPRTKGVRLPSLQQQMETLGCESGAFHILRWYGGTYALRQLVSGTAVWDVEGYPPLPLRWVLVIDPTGKQPPTALFSTCLLLSATEIVELYVSRWSLEVTFEETRAHLGFQSQRQWSKAATTRTTPVLLALFSLTCLIAHRLHAVTPLTPHTTAWYDKPELTFADLLEAVRASLWQARLFPGLASSLTPTLFPEDVRESLIQQLASTF